MSETYEDEETAVRMASEEVDMPGVVHVGDLDSDARGSGARFNNGKLPLELIPLKLMGEALMQYDTNNAISQAMYYLGCYQSGRSPAMLYQAMKVLGFDGWDECARVFEYGAGKYAPWNWAKGMPWTVPLACAARHLLAMARGEMNDQESGLPHRGHVFCNIVMLLTFAQTYQEGDDFAPAGRLA